MVAPRELARTERALLEFVLGQATFHGAPALMQQLVVVTVVGGLPTWLHLAVPSETAAADVPDGPVPGRFMVQSPDRQDEGEILVWVTGGHLSGLEYAWFTDDSPTGMPPVDRLRLA